MLPTTFSELVAAEHQRTLREQAAATRRSRAAARAQEGVLQGLLGRLTRRHAGAGASSHASVTIHLARPGDLPLLRRLAELDSRPLPEAPLLVGEVEGIPRAALGLRSRASVANPFEPSAWLVSLLEVRASQLWPQPPAGDGGTGLATRTAARRRELRVAS